MTRFKKHADQRKQGLRAERKVIQAIAKRLGLETYTGRNTETAEIGSSRALSRVADARKIDIVFPRQRHLSRMGIQVKKRLRKTKAKTIDVRFIDEVKAELPILAHYMTHKSGPSGKLERHEETYFVMTQEVFLELLNGYHLYHREDEDEDDAQ